MQIDYGVEFSIGETGAIVARCDGLEVCTQGDDLEDARRQIREAVEAYVDYLRDKGSLEDVLRESGFSPSPDDPERWVRGIVARESAHVAVPL